MYYVEHFGEFYGPYNIEDACSLCAFFNFIYPKSSTVRDGLGNYVQ